MLIPRVLACTVATLTMAMPACAGAMGSAQEPSATPNRVSVTGQDRDTAQDGPEKIGPRQDPSLASHRLLSTNRWSEMVVKDGAVFLQATDYGLKKVVEPQKAKNSNASIFEELLSSMTLTAFKSILDHSIGLPLTDTKSASVRDGEVIVLTCSGKEVFGKVTINDTVQKYPQDQAERFVKDIMQIRAKLPACKV